MRRLAQRLTLAVDLVIHLNVVDLYRWHRPPVCGMSFFTRAHAACRHMSMARSCVSLSCNGLASRLTCATSDSVKLGDRDHAVISQQANVMRMRCLIGMMVSNRRLGALTIPLDVRLPLS